MKTALTGRWCTKELEKGYQVAWVYEEWHFKHSLDAFFTKYIKMHLKWSKGTTYPALCADEESHRYHVQIYNKMKVSMQSHYRAVKPAIRFLYTAYIYFVEK